MLLKYTYPENHTIGYLNYYLLCFVTSIRYTDENSEFSLENYFDPDFIDILKQSPRLIEVYENFFETYKKLSDNKKEKFQAVLIDSQEFQNVFSDLTIDCQSHKTGAIENLIGNNSFKELSDFLFSCVKYDRWDIKGHYKQIYNALEYKICPFCGVHPLHKTFREDYDHLAPKAIYPLVAANPKNLAPMCHDCNAKNKGEKDILYDSLGNRRSFIYPYTEQIDVRIRFENSVIPQTDIINPEGRWDIVFDPDNNFTENWDSVFNIKNRYISDFVIPNYETWLKDFVTDCIEENIDLNNADTIKRELLRLGNRFQRKWYEQANIIKGPLFQFLANCNNDLFFNSVSSIYNRISNR